MVFSTTLDRNPEPFTQPNIPEDKTLSSCSLLSLPASHLVLVVTLPSQSPPWSGLERRGPRQAESQGGRGRLILEGLVLAAQYSQQEGEASRLLEWRGGRGDPGLAGWWREGSRVLELPGWRTGGGGCCVGLEGWICLEHSQTQTPRILGSLHCPVVELSGWT